MVLWLVFAALVVIVLILIYWDGDRLNTRGLGASLDRIIELLESIQGDLTDIKGDIEELKTDVNAIKDATEPEPAEHDL